MTKLPGSVGDGGEFRPVRDDGKVWVGGKVVKVWSGEPGGCSFAITEGLSCRGDGSLLKGASGEFIDGATVFGPWAVMCRACFRRFGVGIGPGCGQRYSLTVCDDGVARWIKVGG